MSRMLRARRIGLASLSVLALASCADTDAGPATSLAIQVAPLNLVDIDLACYDVRVTNAADGGGQVVWSKGNPAVKLSAGDSTTLCSDRYGSGPGGDLGFVGPCESGLTNSVTLWVDGLYRGTSASPTPIEADAASGWQNPCPNGCTQNVACLANSDVAVPFDLTIMRDANQGFFDVAVTFEDVFCSAKVDCQSSLLQDPTSGARLPTIVLALACTVGQGQTTLYMNDAVLTCPGKTYTLSPVGSAGNRGAQAPGLNQTATYYGTEAFAGIDKCYLNSAFALDLSATDGDAAIGSGCVLTTTASAGEAAKFTSSQGKFWSPANAAYPKIVVNVPITDAAGAICSSHPLNGADQTVKTTYSAMSATGDSYGYKMACGSAPEAAPPQYLTVSSTDRCQAATVLGSTSGFSNPANAFILGAPSANDLQNAFAPDVGKNNYSLIAFRTATTFTPTSINFFGGTDSPEPARAINNFELYAQPACTTSLVGATLVATRSLTNIYSLDPINQYPPPLAGNFAMSVPVSASVNGQCWVARFRQAASASELGYAFVGVRVKEIDCF